MDKKSTIEIETPAPLLNIPEFHVAFGGTDGRQIPKNPLGHPLHYEFVALPGTRLAIEAIHPRHTHAIYHVSTPIYLSSPLFLDSRFTRPASDSNLKEPILPNRGVVATRMEKLLGTQYVWGGNWSPGIPQLLHFYPPQGTIDESMQTLWTLKGVDCSGLLYEATQGATPRNTAELLHLGKPVAIQGKSAQQLLRELLPMDMVVWPGHVWFVLNSKSSIESKFPFGVIQCSLLERLEETLRERRAADQWTSYLDPKTHFVIRRFLS